LLAASQVPDGDWTKAFRLFFSQLRTEVDMHPVAATPSATFEAAAQAARTVAAECLPLGMGLVMHLYPLCALRCVPLPWWSPANFRRQRLLRDIDRRSLILANAGSERAAGAHAPVTLMRTHDGVLVHGKYDYVSLANVADLVLFSAPLGDGGTSLFCIAGLRSQTAHIGAPRFNGSMRLSDTCSVSLESQLLPPGRFVEVPNEAALGCMTQYQRSWFQLLSGEAHLARIEYLQRLWKLARGTEETASRNELALLREYARQLLDEAARPDAVEMLARVTAAMKLRISWMAQSIAAMIQGLDKTAADELLFFKRQPTSDDRILRSIGVASDRGRGVSDRSRAVPEPSPATGITQGEYSLPI
jgi:alkylation response protein AidB-like acyl-CoA dehydrogenase